MINKDKLCYTHNMQCYEETEITDDLLLIEKKKNPKMNLKILHLGKNKCMVAYACMTVNII